MRLSKIDDWIQDLSYLETNIYDHFGMNLSLNFSSLNRINLIEWEEEKEEHRTINNQHWEGTFSIGSKSTNRNYRIVISASTSLSPFQQTKKAKKKQI